MIETDGSFQLNFRIPLMVLLSTYDFSTQVPNAILGNSWADLKASVVTALCGTVENRMRARSEVRVEEVVGVVVKNIESRENLKEYLAQHPLLTSKRFDSFDWMEAHRLVMSHGHKTPEGTVRLQALKTTRDEHILTGHIYRIRLSPFLSFNFVPLLPSVTYKLAILHEQASYVAT